MINVIVHLFVDLVWNVRRIGFKEKIIIFSNTEKKIKQKMNNGRFSKFCSRKDDEFNQIDTCFSCQSSISNVGIK